MALSEDAFSMLYVFKCTVDWDQPIPVSFPHLHICKSVLCKTRRWMGYLCQVQTVASHCLLPSFQSYWVDLAGLAQNYISAVCQSKMAFDLLMALGMSIIDFFQFKYFKVQVVYISDWPLLHSQLRETHTHSEGKSHILGYIFA